MITLEQVKIIREKKYFPNTPGDKKPKGILRNIGDYIRKTGADPMRGDYGSETKDFGKADKTKPLYRGGQTSQGMQTTQGIKKGSIPDPKKLSKLTKPPTILPPAGQKNLLTGKDDIKIKSKRGRKPGSVNKPKVDKTPGQLDLFNQPKGVKQSDISKTQKKFTQEINKANKNRKEFEYAKSKESKTFKGTVTQGANKGRNYTINRNPPPKGIHKNLNKAEVKLRDAKSGRNMKTGRLDPISQDLAKRAARGEPKAVQFTIDMRKDYRRGRGLGKRAERKFDASGGKKTGSLAKGNLSFPGDRTGAYSRAKNQLDFDTALKKARGGTKGDIAPEAPKSVKDYAQSVRDKRIKKLKLPDTSFDSKTKFSQKQFDKALGGAKKSTTTAAPGIFGEPKDIKSKTFKKFQQDSGGFNAKKQAIKDIRASDQRLGKPLSKVQQRKAALRRSKEYTAKQLRDIRMQREFGGGLSGTIGPPTGGPTKGTSSSKPPSVVSTSTSSKSDVERIKQNKIDIKKADAYKKTAAYKNVAQGTDAQGNYLTPDQRKSKFYKQTKKRLNSQDQFVKDFTSKSKRTYSQRVTSYTPKPKTNYVKKVLSKLPKKFIPKGRLGLGLAIGAGTIGTIKLLTRPRSTLKTKTTPIKLNKNTKNISPTSVQFNPKNDPLKLTRGYKNTISFKDLSQFGKGKAYSVPGGIKSGIYTSNELKNVQRRVKQNKKEIDSNTGFYKGDPYGMLDVKTNKKSQRFINAVNMNKNKN